MTGKLVQRRDEVSSDEFVGACLIALTAFCLSSSGGSRFTAQDLALLLTEGNYDIEDGRLFEVVRELVDSGVLVADGVSGVGTRQYRVNRSALDGALADGGASEDMGEADD